jgi:biofilm PGA synthesis N-glycosyltransferase PgaC
MTDQALLNVALLVLASGLGVSMVFWSTMGILRYLSEGVQERAPQTALISVSEVAVVIPAHNEEIALPKCIRALSRIVSPTQIFVASDGSKDRTAEIASSMGCNVLEILPNGGKARALQRAITDNHINPLQRAIAENGLRRRFQAILIQDADAEIDPEYFDYALPLFNDPRVAVVAGHVLSRWPDQWRLRREMVFTAYRTRLYRLLQAVFQYGQSWKWFSVSYIAPGFTSMYRTSIIDSIDIAAPGLVIEDFNMTFEVHHKQLGRIAYTPRARCSSEDPLCLSDYRRQVARWYLGFWQTVRRHGFWPGKFWAALLPLMIELIVVSIILVALPALVVAEAFFGVRPLAWSMTEMSAHLVSPSEVFVAFFCVDYLLTIIVAIVDRRVLLLFYGLTFPFLRIIDAALFLSALAKSFSARSDGRWISPTRYGAREQIPFDTETRRTQHEFHTA